MTPKCGLILFVLLAVPYIESGIVKETGEKPLNDYISYYETLSYDETQTHASHNRAKRSVTKDPYVFLKFRAHSRPFHIRLKRDLVTFSDSLVVDTPQGELSTVDTSHIYHGEVLGEPSSHVFGSIIDGIFEGKIITDTHAYYVENAKHYFPNRTHLDHGFHSIIYNERDVVDDPYAHKRKGHFGGCGINEEVSQWMDSVQNAGVDDEANAFGDDGKRKAKTPKKFADAKMLKRNKLMDAKEFFKDDLKYPHMKYTKEANLKDNRASSVGDGNDGAAIDDDVDDDEWHRRSHARAKRAARPKEENRNTCSLYIQTDPLIWRHIREGIADHDRGRKSEIDEKTREEILSLIAHHVTAVNYIYRNTKFDGRVEHRNIRFEVQRIKIDDDSACTESYNGDLNPFCMENIDVSNFLNLHSLGNHEFFCLAYVFTYRDFTGGTLGLAWVASASGASGGICERYKTYTETVGGLYQSTKRSLNTGIITFVNYNSRVPPKVSQLTLAHEIGHNFGSPHDYPQDCRPGGSNGNYIMFASATSGDRPNNSKFSTCSIRNISNVLDAIEDSKKRNCFTASEGAFCGNKIVEIGEECDCGFNDEECQDKCCYPRLISDSDLSVNSSARGCTRRAYTQCSPSQGPCCLSDKCIFVPANYHQKCKEETECSWSSTCNGTTPECPEPKPRDDKTKCNNGTQLCINGDCSGSICLLWNMSECFLTSQLIENIDKRKLCELACQNGNDTSTCRSTSEFGLEVGLPAEGISLRPGSPCDNFQGYCDVFLKCRAVDAEGPLVRLKNLLFNEHTFNTVQEWVTDYWYVCVLLGIIFIIFMGIFIKCCAVHTPSSNPKKPPARRFSETLRRPMHTLRRMRPRNHHGRHASAVRSIPPPLQPSERSRSADGGHSSRGGGGGGRSHHSSNLHSHGASSSSSARAYASGSGSGSGNGGRRQQHPSSGASRPPNSSSARAMHHGYGGDGRVVDPPVNYNRNNNNQHMYADAYPDRVPIAATSSNHEYPISSRLQPTSTATNKV